MEEDRKEQQDLEDRIRAELGVLEVNLTVEIPGQDVIEIGTFDIESDNLIEEMRERCHEVTDRVLSYSDKKNARLNANFSFSKDRRAYLHMHIRLFEFREFFQDHRELAKKVEVVFDKIFNPVEAPDELAAYLEPHIPKILIVGCDSRLNTKQLAQVLSSEIGMTCVQSLETASAIKAHLAPTKEDPLALHVPPFVISLPDNQFGMGDDVVRGLSQIDGLKFEWSWRHVSNGDVKIIDDVNRRAAKRLLEVDMLKASKKAAKQ